MHPKALTLSLIVNSLCLVLAGCVAASAEDGGSLAPGGERGNAVYLKPWTTLWRHVGDDTELRVSEDGNGLLIEATIEEEEGQPKGGAIYIGRGTDNELSTLTAKPQGDSAPFIDALDKIIWQNSLFDPLSRDSRGGTNWAFACADAAKRLTQQRNGTLAAKEYDLTKGRADYDRTDTVERQLERCYATARARDRRPETELLHCDVWQEKSFNGNRTWEGDLVVSYDPDTREFLAVGDPERSSDVSFVAYWIAPGIEQPAAASYTFATAGDHQFYTESDYKREKGQPLNLSLLVLENVITEETLRLRMEDLGDERVIEASNCTANGAFGELEALVGFDDQGTPGGEPRTGDSGSSEPTTTPEDSDDGPDCTKWYNFWRTSCNPPVDDGCTGSGSDEHCS